MWILHYRWTLMVFIFQKLNLLFALLDWLQALFRSLFGIYSILHIAPTVPQSSILPYPSWNDRSLKSGLCMTDDKKIKNNKKGLENIKQKVTLFHKRSELSHYDCRNNIHQWNKEAVIISRFWCFDEFFSCGFKVFY